MAFTGVGFDGTIAEVELSQLLDAVADHGVVGDYNGSAFSAAKVIGSRTMAVQPGYILAPGVLGHLDGVMNATAAAAPSPALSGSQQRIDLLVARFDWSGTGGTCSLVMKTGTQSATPVAPAVTQTPGVLFEVPIKQGLLTAAVQGEYTTTSMVDRRYWVEAGKYVLPSTTQLPPGRTGAVAYRPDTHQMLVNNGTAWDTFKADSPTGWAVIGGAPGGFSGNLYGAKLNGVTQIEWSWQKTGGSITNTDFAFALPTGWKPTQDMARSLWAGTSQFRVYIGGGDGVANYNNVTISVGSYITGGITFI